MTLYPKIILGVLIALHSSLLIAQICQTTTIPATTPSSRFAVQSNGTVTDRKTGLMWKQCSEGLGGAGCSVGKAATYTWQGALQRAQTVNVAGFAGFKDWRVPNIKELSSLVEEQCSSPAINASVFPNTSFGYSYKSASAVASYSNYAWDMNFNVGSDGLSDNSYGSYVRLVRGGQ